jgi:hypothetical protein
LSGDGARAPDVEPVALEEEVRRVESDSTEEGRQVEELEVVAEDLDFVSVELREKAVGRVVELAERMGELCRDKVTELEGVREFTQDLGGRYKGWRLMFDVRVRVRRSP